MLMEKVSSWNFGTPLSFEFASPSLFSQRKIQSSFSHHRSRVSLSLLSVLPRMFSLSFYEKKKLWDRECYSRYAKVQYHALVTIIAHLRCEIWIENSLESVRSNESHKNSYTFTENFYSKKINKERRELYDNKAKCVWPRFCSIRIFCRYV